MYLVVRSLLFTSLTLTKPRVFSLLGSIHLKSDRILSIDFCTTTVANDMEQ